MNSLHLSNFDEHQFGASYPLNDLHLRKLVKLFNEPHQAAEIPLGGRRSISTTQLDGIGSVVVKHYRRGGWLSHLIDKTYFKWGKHRCRLEFEQMQNAISAGVRVPEPIAYAYRGLIFYKAWLVTKEINNQQSLAQLSLDAPDRAEMVTHALIDQVTTLIDHHIFHADFHPGNILVNNQDKIYIIDFDKAGPYRGSKKLLKHRYLKRWHRAIIKHDLPEDLYQILRANL
jgi:3-deoxy-D-manno-octulosonic acid kinase